MEEAEMWTLYSNMGDTVPKTASVCVRERCEIVFLIFYNFSWVFSCSFFVIVLLIGGQPKKKEKQVKKNSESGSLRNENTRRHG